MIDAVIFVVELVLREAPAGVGLCRLLDVLLRVMAFAKGEKFHHLAGKILVGLVFEAVGAVEIPKHGRVLGNGDEQVIEISRGVLPESLVLEPEKIGRPDFFKAGGEVAMPEEGHLLLEGTRPEGHAADPPVTEIHHLRGLGDVLLSPELPFGLGIGGVPDRQAPGDQIGIGMRPVGGRGRVGDFLVIDKPGDRAVHPHLEQVLNVLRTAAKTGAIHQMGGRNRVPLRGGQLFQHMGLNHGSGRELRGITL